MVDRHAYRAPTWLPGGHLQTIWSAKLARRDRAPAGWLHRERWTTPDGDFVDVDLSLRPSDAAASGTSDAPLLVMFHGLEGSSDSHYAQAFAAYAHRRGWQFALPHFRGCSGEINLAPRAYHSGDHEEIGWMLGRLRAMAGRPVWAVGVSLGGNALLRWAQEAGADAHRTADAIAAICSPIDLAAGGEALGRGFNRRIYTPMFLSTMKPKALRKLQQHPGLFSRERLLAARTLYDFDNVFTAPLHGFRNTEDYWRRASAKPRLGEIRIPALVLNALNDPFVPADCLPRAADAGPWVTLAQPREGGHVGFASGGLPGHLGHLPEAVCGWLKEHAPHG